MDYPKMEEDQVQYAVKEEFVCPAVVDNTQILAKCLGYGSVMDTAVNNLSVVQGEVALFQTKNIDELGTCAMAIFSEHEARDEKKDPSSPSFIPIDFDLKGRLVRVVGKHIIHKVFTEEKAPYAFIRNVMKSNEDGSASIRIDWK